MNEGGPKATCSALVCHPHPLGGGTMHNKVVYHAMKVLNDPQWGFEWPVLRFNFRGTGLSAGSHHGNTESGDVEAATRWLRAKFRLPVVVIGFSFGAAMVVKACCGHQCPSGIQALAAIGLPIHAQDRDYTYPGLGACTLPKLFVSGDRDEFASCDDLTQIVATASDPKQLVFVPDADHFFTGQLTALQTALADWLTRVACPPLQPTHPV